MNQSALTNRNFRIYLGGALFVLVGLWVYRVTLAWLAWELTESELAVGIVAFCQFAPGIVMGPFFGVLADRLDLIKAASIIQFMVLVTALTLCICSLFGLIGIELLALFSLAQGLLQSAYTPIRLALIPRLVPHELLASATGLIATVFNLSRFLGPALAGIIISLLGPSWSFAIFACMIVPAIAVLQVVKVSTERERTHKRSHLITELNEGIHYVIKHPLIRWLFLLVGMNGLLARGILELLPAITDLMLNYGSGGFAALTSAAGVGAIAASLHISTSSSDTRGLLKRSLIASTLSGVLVFLMGISTHYWLALVVVCGIGFSCTLCSVSIQTLIQLRLDNRYRGRVMGFWGVFAMGASALGALFLGGLSHLVSLANAIMGCAFLLIIFSVWISLTLLRTSRISNHQAEGAN